MLKVTAEVGEVSSSYYTGWGSNGGEGWRYREKISDFKSRLCDVFHLSNIPIYEKGADKLNCDILCRIKKR
jgi:hypothetical protein